MQPWIESAMKNPAVSSGTSGGRENVSGSSGSNGGTTRSVRTYCWPAPSVTLSTASSNVQSFVREVK